MPANAVIGIDVDLKVQKALDELKRLSPGADKEAKAITTALAKSMKDSAAQVKKMSAAAAADLAKVGTGTEASASKALKALGPLGGVLSRISPEAGAAASSIAGLTSAFDGLGAAELAATPAPVAIALAAVAIALAAVGTAYVVYRAQLDDTTGSQASLRDRLTETVAELARADVAVRASAKSWAAFSDASQVARDKLDVLTGQQNQYDVSAAQSRAAAEAGAREGIQAAGLELAAAREELAAREALLPSLDEGTRARSAQTEAIGAGMDRVHAATAALADHKQALSDALTVIDATTAAEKANAKATVDAASAVKASARAARDAATLAASAKVDDAGAAERARIAHQIRDQEHADEKAESDYRASEAAKQIADAQTVADAQIAAAQKVLDAEKAASAQRISDQQAVGSALIGLGHELVDATTRQYNTTTAAGRKAAMEQFNAQKAANLAMAVIAGALAVQQALASGPPPASFVLAAITGVAAAVEVGVIAAAQPSFHAGGLAPDETTAKVLPGEQIINKQGVSTFGRDGGRANAGMSPAPSRTEIALVVGHEILARIVSEASSRNGVLASRSVPYGHKAYSWQP